MNNIKISVIIPVYNSEKYLSACIKSILNQTYPNWELIIVNDGSTDNSAKIINRFISIDKRIKQIYQKNSGPGIARNIGIKEASGDYIVFVDSDDTINKNYFELLSNKEEDIVYIDCTLVDENYRIIRKQYLSRYDGISKEQFLRSQITGKINWGGCRKAVKKTLLKKYDIKYSNDKIGEEAIYSFLVLHYADSFGFIHEPLYNYLDHEGSQSKLLMDDPWGEVFLSLKKHIISLGLYNVYAATLNAFCITSTLVSLDRISLNYNHCDYIKKSKQRIEKYNLQIDKKYGIDYKYLNSKARFLYPIIYLRMYNLFYVISNSRKIIQKYKISF